MDAVTQIREDEMTDAEMIEWIGKATYEDLLTTWRRAPAGSRWFSGEVAVCYQNTMSEKRRHITGQEMTEISKRVGW